ncbi:MAG: hypothetical protein AAFX99_05620 [Myxococcota bacterium]
MDNLEQDSASEWEVLSNWSVPKETPRRVLDMGAGPGIHWGVGGSLVVVLAGVAILWVLIYPFRTLLDDPCALVSCMLVYSAPFGLWLLFPRWLKAVRTRAARRRLVEQGERVRVRIGPASKHVSLLEDGGGELGLSLGICDHPNMPELAAGRTLDLVALKHEDQWLIPAVERIVFDGPAEHRPETLPAPPPLQHPPQPTAGSAPVHSPSAQGSLSWDDSKLTLTMEGKPPQTVAWDAPFVVGLTTWLMASHRARLTVTVRPTGVIGREEGVEISTVLPQACLDRTLDVLQSDAPQLDLQDFAPFWAMLRWQSVAHGQDIPQVHLGQPSTFEAPGLQTQGLLPLMGRMMVIIAVALGSSLFFDALYTYVWLDSSAIECAHEQPSQPLDSWPCLQRADMYVKEHEVDEAFDLYVRLCTENRSQEGCRRALGLRDRVEPNQREAWPRYILVGGACGLGHTEQCMLEAKAYIQGSDGAPKDPNKAEKAYARACELGAYEGCIKAAEMIPRPGDDASPEARTHYHVGLVRYYAKACNIDIRSEACCRIAQIHLENQGAQFSKKSGCLLVSRGHCTALMELCSEP